MGEPTLHLQPGADERDEARVLDEANAMMVEAVKTVKILSAEMQKRFAQIDAARKVMDDMGVSMRVRFDAPTMSAYHRWRDATATVDVFDATATVDVFDATATVDVFDVPDFVR